MYVQYYHVVYILIYSVYYGHNNYCLEGYGELRMHILCLVPSTEKFLSVDHIEIELTVYMYIHVYSFCADLTVMVSY